MVLNNYNKKLLKGNPKQFFYWCRMWDSNPHGIATNGF